MGRALNRFALFFQTVHVQFVCRTVYGCRCAAIMYFGRLVAYFLSLLCILGVVVHWPDVMDVHVCSFCQSDSIEPRVNRLSDGTLVQMLHSGPHGRQVCMLVALLGLPAADIICAHMHGKYT